MFIAILALGILWNIAGFALPYFVFSSIGPIPPGAPAEFRDGFDIMWKVMMVFSLLMAVIFACLFGWIIKRLVSHEIKSEFVAPSSQDR